MCAHRKVLQVRCASVLLILQSAARRKRPAAGRSHHAGLHKGAKKTSKMLHIKLRHSGTKGIRPDGLGMAESGKVGKFSPGGGRWEWSARGGSACPSAAPPGEGVETHFPRPDHSASSVLACSAAAINPVSTWPGVGLACLLDFVLDGGFFISPRKVS